MWRGLALGLPLRRQRVTLSWVPLRPGPPWPLQPSLQPARGRWAPRGLWLLWPVLASVEASVPTVFVQDPKGSVMGAGRQGWERLGRHPLRSERGVGMESLPVAVRFPWGKNGDFLKFFFFFLAMPHGLQDLSFPSRD